MSTTWNYMIAQLSGEFDYLANHEGITDQQKTEAMSIYVEAILMSPDAIITYHNPNV